MKNLYSKSKGKIHPSPSPPPSSISSSSSAAAVNGGDALSVLKLLPVAIFALTAALAFEDKEVVAYLMLRSIDGSSAVEDRRRCRRIVGVHRPLFDCGCFDCYRSFWSRWDCSKDRDVIHMVIEAFEEHLASKERKKGKGKEKRKWKKEKKEKGEEKVEDEVVIVEAEESKGFDEGAVSVSEECFSADVAKEEGEVVEIPAVSGGERRRGWADVVGMFNSRLWSLWSPGD